MKRGDKVIFKSNTPCFVWGIETKQMLGCIYTIRSIMEPFPGRKCYTLKEFDYFFPADIFIPYKGLAVLIDRRRKYEL